MTTPGKFIKLQEYLCTEFKLYPDEAEALINFKRGKRELNQNIRKCKLTLEEEQFCRSLENALKKLPSIQEPIIYRNLSFHDDQLSNAKKFFAVDKKIRFKDFQHCTILECFTGCQSSQYNCTIKIKTSQHTQAKNIFLLWNRVELNDAEKEVLYTRNSCFKIEEVEIHDQRINLTLEEIKTDLEISAVPQF